MDDLQIQLQAVLDDNSLTEIQKQLAKKAFQITASIDIKDAKKSIEALADAMAALQNPAKTAGSEIGSATGMVEKFVESLEWAANQVNLFERAALGISAILDSKNVGNPEMFGFCFEFADYYKCSLGY